MARLDFGTLLQFISVLMPCKSFPTITGGCQHPYHFQYLGKTHKKHTYTTYVHTYRYGMLCSRCISI